MFECYWELHGNNNNVHCLYKGLSLEKMKACYILLPQPDLFNPLPNQLSGKHVPKHKQQGTLSKQYTITGKAFYFNHLAPTNASVNQKPFPLQILLKGS